MVHGKRNDMIVHQQEPYNAEPPRAALADRALTPLDAFYSRNHGPIPHIDQETWRVRVEGLVEHQLQLSLAQLRETFEQQTLVATLQCAGNRRTGLLEIRDIPGEAPWGATATSTAEWTGIRLSDVLGAAGLEPTAGHVEFVGPDIARDAKPPQPYGSSIPVHKASSGEVLLAWAMNGEPLPAVHGGPVRVVVPGYIGARSVKWVQRVTVLEQPSDNYFQAVAYRLPPVDADPAAGGPGQGRSLASVTLNSEILTPDDGELLPAGRSRVTGYAIAPDGDSVARVEVSVDEGRTWHQAGIQAPPSAWAWCHWQTALELAPGDVQIVARARSNAGDMQPESAEALWNPKGYMNNSWARVQVTVRDAEESSS
jgi:sulfite oxidase